MSKYLKESERNYLIRLIKSKAYDRLSYDDKENVKLINDNNYNLTIEDMIKDLILIKATNVELNETALHKYIIEMVSDKF